MKQQSYYMRRASSRRIAANRQRVESVIDREEAAREREQELIRSAPENNPQFSTGTNPSPTYSGANVKDCH